MCQGNDEAIPVSVLLVSMYNACYTYQGCIDKTDNRINLLILTLKGLDQGRAMSDKAIIRTMSTYGGNIFLFISQPWFYNPNL